MNEKFIKQIQLSQKSLYRISEETGIPYTNLSKLKNGIQDINDCSGRILYKIALYFGCKIEDLLNPESYIVGKHGIYRKIKYRWINTKENDELQICKKDEYITAYKAKPQTNIENYITVQALTEIIIDEYLLEKEREKIYENLSSYA